MPGVAGPLIRAAIDGESLRVDVAAARDGAEKLSGRTAPYGRGSVCGCKRLVSILSRDHRERSSAFFSIVARACCRVWPGYTFTRTVCD
jgi:hypothetical protein